MGKKSRKSKKSREKVAKSAPTNPKATTNPSNMNDTTAPTHLDDSTYAQYQQAARLIIDFLSKSTSRKITAIGDLVGAAEQMVTRGGHVELDPSITNALETVMESHSVAQQTFQGTSKHSQALGKIWQMIIMLLLISGKQDGGGGSSPITIMDPALLFALCLNQDDDDDDDSNQDTADTLPVTPTKKSNNKDSGAGHGKNDEQMEAMGLAIEELINGDDWFRCACFLFDVNRLMSGVLNLWAIYKQEWGPARRDKQMTKVCMSKIVGSSLATNAIIADMEQLERALAQDYPHLGSFYNILATIIFQEQVFVLERHGVPHATAIQCIGQVMQAVIEDPTGWDICSTFGKSPPARAAKAIKELRSFRRCSRADIDKLVNHVVKATILETTSIQDFVPSSQVDDKDSSVYYKEPMSWLQGFQFIGTQYCLFNTFMLIQKAKRFLETSVNDVRIKEDYAWKEENAFGPISFNMDMILLNDLYGHLTVKDRVQQGGDDHPLVQALFPVFDMMRDNKGAAATRVSMSFAFHSILMSLSVVQGDNDVKALSIQSQLQMSTFFDQVSKTRQDNPRVGALCDQALKLKHVANIPDILMEERTSPLLYWNPYFAGLWLAFATFLPLELAQSSSCRIVFLALNLYHVLNIYRFTPEASILSQLIHVLRHELWEKGPPRKGFTGSAFRDNVERFSKLSMGQWSRSYEAARHKNMDIKYGIQGNPLYKIFEEQSSKAAFMVASVAQERNLLKMNMISVIGILEGLLHSIETLYLDKKGETNFEDWIGQLLTGLDNDDPEAVALAKEVAPCIECFLAGIEETDYEIF